MASLKKPINLLLCFLLLCSLFFSSWGMLAEAKIRTGKIKSDKAYTFYLTGERVCKKCYWRYAENGRIELSNKAGLAATYDRGEIMGVDNHPIMRRLLRKSIYGVGIPGRVINPTAFDDEKHIDHP